tara:strand:- start:6061 stop:6255 length:195 start_codon:yes stop_codon:yes gene_type:complete
MKQKLGCYIDENDEFRSDVEKMSKWYNQAMETLDKMPVSNEEIPFLLFLMGAEAGLRCQHTTLH